MNPTQFPTVSVEPSSVIYKGHNNIEVGVWALDTQDPRLMAAQRVPNESPVPMSMSWTEFTSFLADARQRVLNGSGEPLRSRRANVNHTAHETPPIDLSRGMGQYLETK